MDSGYQLFFAGEMAKSLYLITAKSGVLTMNMGEKGDQKVEDAEHPSFGYYFMQKLPGVIGERLISKCAQIMSLVP